MSSLAELVRTATTLGSKEVASQQQIDAGFRVIKKVRPKMVEIWVSKRAGDRSVTVKVSGPEADQDFLVEIAESLEVPE